LAFLFRLGLTGGFLPYELTGIGLACLLVLIFPFVAAPTGFAALLIVTALIARRALTRQRLTSPVAGTATPTAHAG
jgi:hypothetical protein